MDRSSVCHLDDRSSKLHDLAFEQLSVTIAVRQMEQPNLLHTVGIIGFQKILYVLQTEM
ncbi:hypothetical protein D3C75_1344460 [compost metagenome]